VVLELDLALVHRAADRRGAGGLGRGQRDVAFAGQQAGGRVQADPAGAGQVDLAPGVQVGEVDLGAAGAVERLHVGLQLDQVARHEARRQAQVAQQLHQQPAESRHEPEALVSVSSGVCTPGSMRIR
jgi:type IV secretory pathway TrbL component